MSVRRNKTYAHSLDDIATEFLRENGDKAKAEPWPQRFSSNGKTISDNVYVPLAAFLKPAKPLKMRACIYPCQDCGGPKAYTSGKRCSACWKAEVRGNFIARCNAKARARGEVESYISPSVGWTGPFGARECVPTVNPWEELEITPQAVEDMRAALDSTDQIQAVRNLVLALGLDPDSIHRKEE